MRRSIILILCISTLYMPGGAAGQGIGAIYSQEILRADQDRYVRRMNELFQVRLWSFFTPQEQAIFSRVEHQVPLVGQGRNPFDFYAYRSPTGPVVVTPVIALKFVEDLAIAYAWIYAKECRLESIDEYVAMLRYVQEGELPTGRYAPPLEALGIPHDGWQDPDVHDLYLRFRNTGWAFILLHELGHVLHRHPGNDAVSPVRSQQNERAADRFALDVLGRSQTIPMGMILWFQATAPWFPNRADYVSEAAFQEAVQQSLTHPLSAERLQAMAQHMMTRWPTHDISPVGREAVLYIGRRLELIAERLRDPDMQMLVAAQALRHHDDTSACRE